jgi:ligand-binding sensor domain-containing protein
MNFFLKIWLPLFLSGSFFVSAQSYNWTNFSTNNSPIPNDAVRALCSQGNDLWIGTDWGLCHKQDDNWTIFNYENSPLTDNYIRALSVDQSNKVWVGTTVGGVFTYDGLNWMNYNMTNSGLPSNFIRAITHDEHGNVWIGTVDGLARYDGTEWTIWNTENAGFMSNNITSIAIDESNNKIIGTINGGLIILSNEGVHLYTLLEHGLPDNSILDIAFDVDGKPWFASPSGGMFKQTSENNWLVYNESNSPLTSNSLSSIARDINNNFFVGTKEWGLVRFKPPNSWVIYNMDNSPIEDDRILSIETTLNGDIWVGTEIGGLHRLKDLNSEIENLIYSTISIGPNPFDDYLKINSSTTDPIQQLSIFNTQGGRIQFISKNEGDSFQLETSHFAPGTYFMVLTTSTETYQIKLIKN